ncbi:hypothetical protein F5051DRAFT_439792 [Lentinula edodes]|uniref:Uncharacterized protein n=1 Tax=Lentinula lateritia TaxID=40482 RepID=A0A9W9A525_9AGAR|nr:hypothetical protein F5051DRAFT_439792 [Lentinula edodes]KAJ4474700.1 hypothetical protein C8J55DRAFT_130669 [Lentinula edodes]
MIKSVLVATSMLTFAYGHAVITAVAGDNGVSTSGFGVTTDGSVPRNGTTEQPFQLDTPVLKNLVDDPCGATLLGGSIGMTSSLATAITQGGGNLPSLAADNSISFTLHQVNADGGGPFSAMVNTDATGQTWTSALITQQPPGANGLLSGGPVDSQVTAALPAGTTCTGTSADGSISNICLIRISNGGTGNEAASLASFANGAGPFGGCFAVTTSSSTTASSATTASASAAAATTAAATTTKTTKKNKNNRSLELIGRLAPGLMRRQSELDALVAQNRALEEDIQLKVRELEERQLLTVAMMDEIATAVGTADDIPVDAFAGQTDEGANGGNSSTSSTAKLSLQDAVNLKAALRTQVEGVLAAFAANQNASLLTAGSDFNFTGNLTTETVAQANSDADAAQAAGTTSINAGNAGVGEVQTAVKNSLLGEVSTVQSVTNGATLLGASPTTAAAVATTTAAAAATTTAAASVSSAAAAAVTSTTTNKKSKNNKASTNNAASNKDDKSARALNKRLLRSRVRAVFDDAE